MAAGWENRWHTCRAAPRGDRGCAVRAGGQALDGRLADLLPGGARTPLQRLVLELDWAATPLGPEETWSPTLQTTAATCLNSRFPMMLVWGPELVMLYNDGYAQMLGDRHPSALGSPMDQVWADVWPVVGPMVDDVRAGDATYSEDLPLVMGRHGFDEETYFTFSYSPVVEPDGDVAGLLDTAVETTQRVLAARRMAVLQRLGSLPRSVHASVTDACAAALAVLADARADCPLGWCTSPATSPARRTPGWSPRPASGRRTGSPTASSLPRCGRRS